MGNSGFISSHCRRIRPHLAWRWGTRDSSKEATRISGFLSNSNRGFRPPLEFRGGPGVPLELLQGNWASSRVEAEHSVFFSSCGRKLGFPLEWQWGTWVSSRVVMGNLGFHSTCNRSVRPPLELSWGNSSLAGMCRVVPVFLQCWEATHEFWHGTSLSLCLG